jgi:hypothetical protein
MKKNLSRILLSCAVVVAIGAVAVAGNGLILANAIAGTNQTSPIVSADKVSAQENTGTSIGADTKNEAQSQDGYQIINKANGQIIVKTLPNGDFELISDNTKPTFVSGTPGKNDITKEKAIEIARSAIIKKYALSDEALSKFTVSADFNIVNPEQPIWQVNFLPTDQSDYSQIGNYFITINSPSGEVVKLLSAADGIG